MSLESSIAELVSRTNALLNTFTGKDAAINAALDAALTATSAAVLHIYIDPVNGSDTNTGAENSKVLTLDRALTLAKSAAVVRIYALGNVTLTQRHDMYCQVLQIIGVRYDAAALEKYPRETRTITYAAEADVAWDGARSIPSIIQHGRVVRLTYCNVVIADPPAGVTNLSMIDMVSGGALLLENSTVSASNTATTAVLSAVWIPNQLIFAGYALTVAASAKGHVLAGVAANADPNAQWAYRSNLTSL